MFADYGMGANRYIVKPVGFDGFAKAMLDGMCRLLLNNPPKP